MKQVIAFIRPSKEDEVCQALHAINGLSGASFADVRGFGRGRHGRSEQDIREAVAGALPQVRVDVVVPAALAPRVVDAIARAAHTGNRGDGKVYVATVDTAQRISTRETGPAAV